jgi:hypothetical protein
LDLPWTTGNDGLYQYGLSESRELQEIHKGGTRQVSKRLQTPGDFERTPSPGHVGYLFQLAVVQLCECGRQTTIRRSPSVASIAPESWVGSATRTEEAADGWILEREAQDAYEGAELDGAALEEIRTVGWWMDSLDYAPKGFHQ